MSARQQAKIVLAALGLPVSALGEILKQWGDGDGDWSGIELWCVNMEIDIPLPAFVQTFQTGSGVGVGALFKATCERAQQENVDLLIPLLQSVKSIDGPRRLIRAWRSDGGDLVWGKHPDGRQSPRWVDRLLRRTSGHDVDFLDVGRAYSGALLNRVRYYLNNETPAFEIELLLQALQIGCRIYGVPLDESFYAEKRSPYLLALRAGIGYRLHEWGMLCSLKYRRKNCLQYTDKTGVPYSSHAMALKVVAAKRPAQLLDLGCGPGYVSRRCEEQGVRVTGADIIPPVEGMMSRFVELRLGDMEFPFDLQPFDLILMLDVIEHLAEPEEFLLHLRQLLNAADASPALVVSTPNVAFALVRLNLLLGRFPYAERGILDITHCRLFTRASLCRALRVCGYEIERVSAVPVPFATVMGAWPGHVLGIVADWAAKLWPTLFAFQFLVVCRPAPPVRLEKSGANQS